MGYINRDKHVFRGTKYPYISRDRFCFPVFGFDVSSYASYFLSEQKRVYDLKQSKLEKKVKD